MTTAALVAGTAFVLTHEGGRELSTGIGPRAGESSTTTASPTDVDPDVTHVVLDGWTSTYYLDEPSQDPSKPDYVEYQWQQGTSRDLQLSFYPPGGRITGGTEVSGTLPGGYQRVAVRGTTGEIMSYGTGGRFRADWDEGGRSWEADGSGYADAQAFLDVLAAVHHTDHADWLASLPAGSVNAAHRPAAVDALLAGVPVPPGFDLAGLRTADRAATPYNLGFDVYGHVECGWIARLDTSRGTPAGQQAIDALRSVPQWPGMATLDAGGGAGDVFRTTATQAIAGHTDGYQSALGC